MGIRKAWGSDIKETANYDPVQQEIRAAGKLSDSLVALVAGRQVTVRDYRDPVIMAYWSMVFDYVNGTHCLLANGFYSSAAALMRPMVDAVVYAGRARVGTDQDVDRIMAGKYKISYEKDGQDIDKALGSGKLFETMLKQNRDVLHSMTHSRKAQLTRHASQGEIGQNFTAKEIIGIASFSAGLAFLITIVVGSHLHLRDIGESANRLYSEYGKLKP